MPQWAFRLAKRLSLYRGLRCPSLGTLCGLPKPVFSGDSVSRREDDLGETHPSLSLIASAPIPSYSGHRRSFAPVGRSSVLTISCWGCYGWQGRFLLSFGPPALCFALVPVAGSLTACPQLILSIYKYILFYSKVKGKIHIQGVLQFIKGFVFNEL